MKKTLAVTLAVALVCMTWPATLAAAPRQQTGSIDGTAQNASQQPLGNITVHLRDANGNLVGTATSNADGTFTFSTINPGTYTIEIVDAAGNLLGTATATVTAGAVTTATVTATAAGLAAAAAAGGGGLAGLFTGTSLLVISAAAAAGITIAVVAARGPASPSR